MKQLLIFILALLIIIPFASADQQSLGTFKINTDINLQQIANTSYCNITSVTYPDSTNVISNKVMTKNGVNFNYTLDNGYVNQIGRYIVNGECDTEVWSYDFNVTENGKDNPDGIVIVVFAIAFFLIFGWNLINMSINLEHLAKLDLDMHNLILSIGAFFSLFFYYYMANVFFPNEFILNTSNSILFGAGVVNLFIPILGFVLSFTIGGLRKLE